MRLEKTNSAYSRSSSARIKLHIIQHPKVESLFGICKDFSKTLRASGADETTIIDGRTQLYRLRRLVTGLPLAFDDPEMRIAEIQDALKRMSDHPNYGAVVQHLSQAVDICKSLLDQPSNPIADSLHVLAGTNTLVLTKDFHMSSILGQWLHTNFSSFHIRAATIGDLRNIEEVGKLVYLCSPTYASWKPDGPDWRFVRDPRAMESHFVMYPFGETEISVPGLLAGYPPRRNISSHVPLQVPYFDSIADNETEWSVEERRLDDQGQIHRDELVPARYVRLSGNYFTYLSEESESKVFIVTADTNNKLDVQRETVKDLEVGAFIVLRVEGTTDDFIEQEANRLGAAKYRSSQRRWQNALKESRAREGSLMKVRERLENEFGLVTTGLVDWVTNTRRIGPHSESDFKKLCDYLGIKEDGPKIWEHLNIIRSFHLRAGAGAAKYLRKLLENRDANDPELRESGFFTIKDEGGKGTIGVYRILHIGNLHDVDPRNIETVEKIKTIS